MRAELEDFVTFCRVEPRLADLTCRAYERDARGRVEFRARVAGAGGKRLYFPAESLRRRAAPGSRGRGCRKGSHLVDARAILLFRLESGDDPQGLLTQPTLKAGDSRVPRTLILASGGIDSACLIAMTADDNPEALFVDYGQGARAPEARAASKIAAVFQTPLHTIRVSVAASAEGEIHGRNMLLAQLALFELAGGPGRVLMGIHAGTRYRDCSPAFAELVQRSYDFHSDGRVQFAAPFINHAKREIVALARHLRVPLEQTYSCERGSEPPCEECVSCLDRKGLRDAA